MRLPVLSLRGLRSRRDESSSPLAGPSSILSLHKMVSTKCDAERSVSKTIANVAYLNMMDSDERQEGTTVQPTYPKHGHLCG
jgi:hypothetical protein